LLAAPPRMNILPENGHDFEFYCDEGPGAGGPRPPYWRLAPNTRATARRPLYRRPGVWEPQMYSSRKLILNVWVALCRGCYGCFHFCEISVKLFKFFGLI